MPVLVLLPVAVSAADADTVVMTVAGYDVSLSEFRQYIDGNRGIAANSGLDVDDYAKMYVNYKMKVRAAVDAGIDTTESFRKEFASYRGFELDNFIVDGDYLETTARRSYEESEKLIGNAGLYHLASISFAPENDSEKERSRCIRLSDSIYQALKDGADFTDLALRFSTDKFASRGGDMGWYSLSQIPEGIIPLILPLKEREFTEPFVDIDRMCILKYLEHRDLGTYEENRAELYEWMASNDALMEKAKLRMAEKYSGGTNWGLSDPDSIISYMTDNLENVCPEFNGISREYHDGLLLFEISNREIWSKVQNGSGDLARFFESNPRLFKFDVPCFKGMVFFCRTEENFNEISEILEGHPLEEWFNLVVAYNSSDIKVRVLRGSNDNGVFFKGQNEYVDKLVFDEGSFEPKNGYPYTHVMGHVISRPETLSDDFKGISEIYQSRLEKEWLKTLHKKYRYKINKKVLKQVAVK